jgi:L-fucose mutarotase
MLRATLIHPQILAVLGGAGHHARVLIADGNYPATTKRGPAATVVHLNLMPGIVTCNQVLQAIVSAIPVEAIQTMMYETTGPYALDSDPPVWNEYRQTIRESGLDLSLQPIGYREFYEAVSTPDHILTIQTAYQQRFANVLLTVGVRMD